MLRAIRVHLAVLLGSCLLLSCNDVATSPIRDIRRTSANLNSVLTAPSVLISQVYGGGGNSGATYKNDFIELFNPGASSVDITGWSVQYASTTGTTWQATSLSGTIPAGGFYLIQEAAGTGAAPNLPTPDAVGSGSGIAMAAGAGKVFLSSTTALLSGACPIAATVVDKVSYGSGTSDCGYGTTATLGNATAAIRNSGGCAFTGSMTADFTVAAPTPRNSATTAQPCGGPPPNQPVTVTISPSAASIAAGATQAFTAAAFDASSNPVTTTFTWSTSDAAVATVDATGTATGVGAGTATIKATASNGVFGMATLTVSGPQPPPNHSGDVVISQIYGGGGNSGATFKNDFIEIFNRSTQTVSVDGWSVQQTSAGGTTWNVTPLSGSIPPGGYYLIQEAAGTGGTADLPAPDAAGSIAMGATSGKVLLAQQTAAFTVACPSGTVVVDVASYGSGTNCGTSAPAPSNTTADLRKHGGCTWAQDPANDFATGAPSPRNSSSAPRSCVPGPLDHLAITGSLSVLVGATSQLSVEPLDANDNSVTGASVTWGTSDANVATVSGTGLVTGVSSSGSPATITATATTGGVTKSASVDVSVINPGGINWIDISSSTTSFPPGFQTQLFATARESQGGTIIPATFTFEAVELGFIAAQTVQNTGIITGIAAPTDGSKPGIRITATPAGGGAPFSFVTHSITIEPPVNAPASIYATNDDFGDPTPAGSNSNDFLIRRQQYVLSYNQSRGTPNWVSYELDARQMVAGQDRCNCFTADPMLPASAQILTSDYTSGGYDRGHMTRSADRTAANVDNAITFYLTNVVPQKGDLNQGVWAQFENMLADSARAGRAVYVVTGPLYSRSHGLTFVKNEGKIAIPDSTWKVALIGPANGGNPFTHANVTSFNDLAGLTILAVNMPNVDGVRNDPPSKYFTTVEAIEAATGYDLFSLLSTSFTGAIEFHDRAPQAQFAVTGTPNEGQQLTFNASASSDPDIDRGDLGGRTEGLTYAWQFSDGTTANGRIVQKNFANHGSYTATLTVTDVFGWPASTAQTLTIANLPPTATFVAPSSGSEGSSFTLSLTGGTDPSLVDAAALKYAFDCGAGYSTPSINASATCTPNDQSELTVRGKVIDLGGMFTEYTATVSVSNVAPTAIFGAPSDANQGVSFALSLMNVLDPSTADVAAGFTYAFDCGEGSGFGSATSAPSTSCMPTQLGTRVVRGRVMDKDGGVRSYTANVTVRRLLSALGPAKIWIGLKNSDDVGLPIDLRVEVLVNGVVVASGQQNNLGTGSSGFNNAQLQTLALELTNGAVDVPPGAQLSVRPSVRRTCNAVTGHVSGVVRLWYNGAAVDDGPSRDAGTRFGATIGARSSSYFARLASALDDEAGAARTSADVLVQSSAACPSRPFNSLGTWTITVP
jgi:DNA/RNA endonuclease G (NUC1)